MLYRSLTVFLLTCLTTLSLALGLGLYARYIEPYWVEETHWELPAEHWKGRPLRLAVISDLHAKSADGSYLDSLVQRVLAAKPDAVLLLGDYINDPSLGDSMDAETLGRHLAPLAQLPCFAVLGNHDYNYGVKPISAMLQGFGARLMEKEVQALEMGGDTLYLAGMRCLCRFTEPENQAPLAEGATCLLLTHSPVGSHYAPPGVTATLSAHTHGGQVCLPGGIPLVRPDGRVSWQEMKGAVVTKGKPVYICRGLGTSELPLRLFCRPELLFVELRGGK